ncbi:hypothetical protein SEUCBS139899_004417 [Sporothrix eucalyptigena]
MIVQASGQQQQRAQARTSAPTTPAPGGRIHTPRGASGDMHFAGYELGKISSHCGIPLFSAHGREWIKAQAGEDVGSQILSFVEAPRSGGSLTPSLLAGYALAGSSLDLPPRPVVERCLDAFRLSPFRLVFPVVDHVLFPETIDAAYVQKTSLGQLAAKASIFAFLSVLAAAGAEFREMLPEIDGDECAAKSHHLLSFVLFESNIAVLQTMVMLTIYSLFTGQMDSALKLHGIACRILFVLGGHLPPSSPHSSHDYDGIGYITTARRAKIHLRAIFWLCYSFDKDFALRTGQPPCLEDAHCDLTLPPRYVELVDRYVLRVDAGGNIDHNMLSESYDGAAEAPWLPGDLRLSVMKSKTYRMLFSTEALRKPDAELVRDIRELDEELERWRMSLPAETRPQLFYARAIVPSIHAFDGFDGRLSQGQMMHRTVLHFEYHYLLATIHRAVGRCRTWGSDGGTSDEISMLQSSLTLSVEASRATIFYLRLAMDTLFENCFWLVVCYPMSAALAIFGNIMMHPLHPRSREDLELLNLTLELLKKMQTRDWTPNELANKVHFSVKVVLINGRAGTAPYDSALGRDGINTGGAFLVCVFMAWGVGRRTLFRCGLVGHFGTLFVIGFVGLARDAGAFALPSRLSENPGRGGIALVVYTYPTMYLRRGSV